MHHRPAHVGLGASKTGKGAGKNGFTMAGDRGQQVASVGATEGTARGPDSASRSGSQKPRQAVLWTTGGLARQKAQFTAAPDVNDCTPLSELSTACTRLFCSPQNIPEKTPLNRRRRFVHSQLPATACSELCPVSGHPDCVLTAPHSGQLTWRWAPGTGRRRGRARRPGSTARCCWCCT